MKISAYEKLAKCTVLLVLAVLFLQSWLGEDLLSSVLLAAWMTFPLCTVTALLLYFSQQPESPRGMHYGLLLFWLISTVLLVICMISLLNEPASIIKVSHAAPLMMLVIATPLSVVCTMGYYAWCRVSQQ